MFSYQMFRLCGGIVNSQTINPKKVSINIAPTTLSAIISPAPQAVKLRTKARKKPIAQPTSCRPFWLPHSTFDLSQPSMRSVYALEAADLLQRNRTFGAGYIYPSLALRAPVRHYGLTNSAHSSCPSLRSILCSVISSLRISKCGSYSFSTSSRVTSNGGPPSRPWL